MVFSSYAVPTILGELKRHFRDRTWSVRVPRDLQELALRSTAPSRACRVGKHRSPSVGEIAEAVGASEEQVLEALEAAGAYRAGSLDAPRIVQGEEAGESLADTLGEEESGFRAPRSARRSSRCWRGSPRASASCWSCASARI